MSLLLRDCCENCCEPAVSLRRCDCERAQKVRERVLGSESARERERESERA